MTGGIALVVLDMAGTTVRDDGLVEQAFDAALGSAGLVSGTEEYARAEEHVRRTMGQSKIEVFHALFPSESARARAANDEFERAYDRLVAQRCEPIGGAERVVRTLRDNGIRTCLTTGFARSTRDLVLDRLGWRGLADLVVGPEEAGRGRPHPDMIRTAARRLGLPAAGVAVAGDTGYDMVAGVRSGASVVAGVLTGAHDGPTLTGNGATHVLDSVADLPTVLGM